MTKKLFGIFDKRPMIWFHYVLLTLITTGAFYLINYFYSIAQLNFVAMTAILFAILSISDQLIHKVLGVD